MLQRCKSIQSLEKYRTCKNKLACSVQVFVEGNFSKSLHNSCKQEPNGQSSLAASRDLLGEKTSCLAGKNQTGLFLHINVCMCRAVVPNLGVATPREMGTLREMAAMATLETAPQLSHHHHDKGFCHPHCIKTAPCCHYGHLCVANHKLEVGHNLRQELLGAAGRTTDGLPPLPLLDGRHYRQVH